MSPHLCPRKPPLCCQRPTFPCGFPCGLVFHYQTNTSSQQALHQEIVQCTYQRSIPVLAVLNVTRLVYIELRHSRLISKPIVTVLHRFITRFFMLAFARLFLMLVDKRRVRRASVGPSAWLPVTKTYYRPAPIGVVSSKVR